MTQKPIVSPEIEALLTHFAELEGRIKMLEIKTGLRAGDPHELDDIGMMVSACAEEYAAFRRDNGEQDQ